MFRCSLLTVSLPSPSPFAREELTSKRKITAEAEIELAATPAVYCISKTIAVSNFENYRRVNKSKSYSDTTSNSRCSVDRVIQTAYVEKWRQFQVLAYQRFNAL